MWVLGRDDEMDEMNDDRDNPYLVLGLGAQCYI